MKRIVPLAMALPLTVLVSLLLQAQDPPATADLSGATIETPADLHHSLYGSAAHDPTDAPGGTPGESLVCLSCHAVDTSSGSNEILVERDCLACHSVNGAITDRHHVLYGGQVPDSTDAPYGASSESYVCLSCHEVETSSGRNRFLVERDCRACHGDVNEAPVADPNGPYTGSPGQPVQFDGTGSFDPDGTIVTYRWDFGDGGIGVGSTPTHTYSSTGTYVVLLTVLDDRGATASAATTAEITEAGPGPGSWIVKVPFLPAEFELRLEEFAGVLLVEEVFPDGTILVGVGFESGGFIAWLDAAGSLFYGTVDYDAGTMMGIVFNFQGVNSLWFAEQQP